MVELAAQGIELRNSLRRKHMCKVADIVGRLRQVFHLLGANSRNNVKEEPGKNQPEGQPTCEAKCGHRTPLYGRTRSKLPVTSPPPEPLPPSSLDPNI